MQPKARPWPRLRDDLTLHAGPPDPNGAPTWTLHDPARNQYFSLDWVAFEITSRLVLGDTQSIVDAVDAETTLHIEVDDVQRLLTFLDQNDLVQRHGAEGTAYLTGKHRMRQSGWFHKILHGYLFFRIPLFRPDAWLERLLPHVAFLFSTTFLKLTGLAFLLGLWGVARQWDVFRSTLVDTFSLDGLLGYAGAMIGIKVLHEFGHALAAKRCGCKVPSMGVAFLVMWPMAYTDVTESWKLDSHRKRLLIAASGILTEMIVAAWMLLLWVFLPDGQLRGAAFFLATTSIVATLAINASPLMRFDGYFLLCDFLGRPNLHSRSFAYARWWLREQLFKLGDPKPEEVNRHWHRFYIAFAFAVWIYRLVVFFGIALMVYHFFFKALGILMFGVEVWYFIAKPIVAELKVWYARWDEIGPVLRQRPAFYVGLVVVGLLIIPYDVTVNSQGMLKPEHSFSLLAPQASQVIVMPPAVGTRVAEGTVLMALGSPDLVQKTQRAKVHMETLEKQFSSAGFSQETLKQQAVLKEQLDSARESWLGLVAEQSLLKPHAPFSGVVADIDPDLHIDEWVPKGWELARVIDDQHWIVDTYVTDADLRRLDRGNWGWFIPEAAALPDAWLQIVSIDRDATRVLNDGALGSVAGGEIMVRPQSNRLYPEHSVYRVRLKLTMRGGQIGTGNLRGRVVMLAWPKSLIGDLVRGTLATLVREAGF